MSVSTKYHFRRISNMTEVTSDSYSQARPYELRVMIGGKPQYFRFTEDETTELHLEVQNAREGIPQQRKSRV